MRFEDCKLLPHPIACHGIALDFPRMAGHIQHEVRCSVDLGNSEGLSHWKGTMKADHPITVG